MKCRIGGELLGKFSDIFSFTIEKFSERAVLGFILADQRVEGYKEPFSIARRLPGKVRCFV